VRVDPEVLEEFDIQIGEVGPGTLDETVVLPGEIKFNREQVAYATPRFQGTVQEIRVRLADKVQKGDVLATLENPETLRPFEVKAPFDGTVVAYDITPGQTVEAGAPLFTVADLSTVWADLQIYQRNLSEIEEGLPVVIKGGHDSASYQGEIAYIAPTIDEHTRTGLARVVVQNPDRQWKPGQFIRGVISTEEHPVDVMLPRSAILTMEDETVVFVQTDEGFEPRPVRLGHSDENSFEVLEGLSGGETVVLRNAISLKAEMGKGAFGGHGHAH
jgi:cobalt-zinc-cadmium efflux system membrane fusion protein